MISPPSPSLCESGTAPYSDAPTALCGIVSLASTNLVCSDRTVPQLCPLQLLLPDCIHFSHCSPIGSASAAAPQLHPLQPLFPDCVHFSLLLPDYVECVYLLSRTHSTKCNKYEHHCSSAVYRSSLRTSHFCHTQMHI